MLRQINWWVEVKKSMMTNKQIVLAYEEGKLSVKEIAEQFQIEEESVRIALAADSGEFRKELKKDKTFTEETLDNAVQVMSTLLFSEHDHVKLKASKFIINEHKGRHDVKNLKTLSINVNLINTQMRRAKEALQKTRTIDIESEKHP